MKLASTSLIGQGPGRRSPLSLDIFQGQGLGPPPNPGSAHDRARSAVLGAADRLMIVSGATFLLFSPAETAETSHCF